MNLKARLAIQRDTFSLNVALDLPLRGITGVFGPSGSGKTTLLRAIAGLERHPDVHLKAGPSLWQDGEYFLSVHRRGIGYVFQEASLFEHLNVRGNIEYGLKRIPPGSRKIDIEGIIGLLGLEQLLDRKAALLSGGERQRVAIARALAVSPELLLMDEPLASLDQQRKDEIMPVLASLNRETGVPIIYVTHSVDEIARLADWLILLESGSVRAGGPVNQLLTRTDLPLAHRHEAEAMIEAVAGDYDPRFRLNRLDFAAGRFLVSGAPLAPGKQVRLRLAAQDISLTLEAQSGTSILNIFPTVIDEVVAAENGQVTVRLLLQDIPLLARVTAKSAAVLDLRAGSRVYAQVKSVAVLA